MSDEQATIERFYAAFDKHDGEAMAACYGESIRFSDPVFPNLEGARAGLMWKMLCARATDLRVRASGVRWDGQRGHAHWVANYTFATTGRKVENIIDATFKFRDGKIVQHMDVFDFWRWSRHALGPTGVLLGWSSLVKNKVRAQAEATLAKYEQTL